jgi:hypothetical protein
MAEASDRLAAWWYSLRYQPPRQLLGRVRYTLGWRLYPRFPAAVRAWCEPAARSCRPRPDFSWPAGAPATTAPEPAEPPDWHPSGRSLLSLFQLHYFDWAPHTPRERLLRQIDSWIAANPPGAWPSWHPYPASLRIVNWIRSLGPTMPEAVARSVATQAAFLERNLEFHLGGNHLLENLRALLAAGFRFDGPAAQRWRRRGLDLLLAELNEQVLTDGGHYERAPYYHLRMTNLVADAIALLSGANLPVPPQLRDACERMTGFHRALRHPDGSFPLFHDSIEPDPAPPPPASAPLSFPASGYYILESPHGRLLADYGAPGAEPNPAHHHAGIFSFELSAGSTRIVTDSGTETYDPGPRRDQLRSTAAHSTVRVDGQDQFQPWGGFRVGRRAWVSTVQEIRAPRFQVISASHDGYRRLGVEHRRTILCLPDLGWLVVDDLLGAGQHHFESFLHFAPGLEPSLEAGLLCLRPLGWAVVPFGASAPPEIISDACSPRLGVSEPSRTLVLRGDVPLPTRTGYFLGPQPVSISTQPDRIWLEGPAGTIAIQIDPAMVRPVEVRYN